MCSVTKGVLRNVTKFTGKHLCQNLFFNKEETLLKKRLWHRCFSVNFAYFKEHFFSQNTSGGCFWKDFSIGFVFMLDCFIINVVCKVLKENGNIK